MAKMRNLIGQSWEQEMNARTVCHVLDSSLIAQSVPGPAPFSSLTASPPYRMPTPPVFPTVPVPVSRIYWSEGGGRALPTSMIHEQEDCFQAAQDVDLVQKLLSEPATSPSPIHPSIVKDSQCRLGLPHPHLRPRSEAEQIVEDVATLNFLLAC